MEAQTKPTVQQAAQPVAQRTCPTCHTKLSGEFYFCPNCGRDLKGKPPSVSVISQIGIYSLSFFLPPLGLLPGIKYALKPDKKIRTVGFVAIALTVLSVIITIIVFIQVAQVYTKMLNDISNGAGGSLYGL